MADEAPNIVLHGGPGDGALMHTRSASVLLDGRDHERPGEVARYRQTKTKIEAGTITVYAFKGWDRVVAQIGG